MIGKHLREKFFFRDLFSSHEVFSQNNGNLRKIETSDFELNATAFMGSDT